MGNVCIDKWEASVWQIPTTNTSLIKKVQKGKVTLADLMAAGALRLGCNFAPWGAALYPAGFPNDGNWTPVLGSDPPSPGVYAVSIPGVLPTTCTSWFRAEQACALSGKRLPTNQEWQRAAAGTPDPGAADDGITTCATNSPNPVFNRLAQRVRVELGRIRHGRQRRRVGGQLAAVLGRVHGLADERGLHRWGRQLPEQRRREWARPFARCARPRRELGQRRR